MLVVVEVGAFLRNPNSSQEGQVSWCVNPTDPSRGKKVHLQNVSMRDSAAAGSVAESKKNVSVVR